MIIGVTGKRLSGKDTVGQYLVDNHGFERIAFADKLKEGVAALFGLTVEQVNDFKDNRGGSLDRVEVSILMNNEVQWTYGWVEFLQRFGTDMGRETWGEDFWVNLAFVDPIEFHHAPQHYEDRNIVVTDVRFDNEATRIKDLGGIIIKLDRPVVDKENDAHKSEDGISEEYVDYIIANDLDIAHLHECVEGVLEDIRDR